MDSKLHSHDGGLWSSFVTLVEHQIIITFFQARAVQHPREGSVGFVVCWDHPSAEIQTCHKFSEYSPVQPIILLRSCHCFSSTNGQVANHVDIIWASFCLDCSCKIWSFAGALRKTKMQGRLNGPPWP